MSDIAAVETALRDTVAQAIYPQGVPAGPEPISPIVGVPVRVGRGYPDAAELDADLKSGIVNISVLAEKDMSTDRTRFDTEWRVSVAPVTTLSASVGAGIVTFAGVPGVRQLAGVRLGGPGAPAYSVALAADDGPEAAAAALAAIVPGALAVGATLTIPGILRPVARTEGFGTVQREVGREEHVFRLVLWCPTAEVRDAASPAVDFALRSIDWIDLPDGNGGRIRYRGTTEDDAASEAHLWRRDLSYSVEFPTVERVTAPAVMWGEVFIQDAIAGEVRRVTA